MAVEVIQQGDDWVLIRVQDEKGSRAIGIAIAAIPSLIAQLEEAYLAVHKGGES